MPKGQHPNSKAALKPFKPGQSGNPRGRTPGTVYIKEALSSLMARSWGEVSEVADDSEQPIAYRIAAKRLLLAHDTETGGVRSDRAFDQVADRTEGRPHQSAQIAVEDIADPQQLLNSVLEEFGDMAQGEGQYAEIESKEEEKE